MSKSRGSEIAQRRFVGMTKKMKTGLLSNQKSGNMANNRITLHFELYLIKGRKVSVVFFEN